MPQSSRYPILYAHHFFRSNIYLPLVVIVLGVVLAGISYVQHRPFFQVELSLIYLPLGLAYMGVMALMRRRSYVRSDTEYLVVSRLLRLDRIPYDQLRTVRVAPLKNAYRQEDGRSRLLSGPYRRMGEVPTTFFRLDAEEPELREHHRVLGSRLCYKDVLALPVADARGLADEVSSRLPNHRPVVPPRRKKRRR